MTAGRCCTDPIASQRCKPNGTRVPAIPGTASPSTDRYRAVVHLNLDPTRQAPLVRRRFDTCSVFGAQ